MMTFHLWILASSTNATAIPAGGDAVISASS